MNVAITERPKSWSRGIFERAGRSAPGSAALTTPPHSMGPVKRALVIFQCSADVWSLQVLRSIFSLKLLALYQQARVSKIQCGNMPVM